MEKENLIKKLLGNADKLDEVDYKMALIYCDKDFLVSKGVWNDSVRRKVAQYNTLKNFTNLRQVEIYSNLIAFSKLFCYFKYNLEDEDTIDGDVLTIQDIFYSKGKEYINTINNELFDIIDNNRACTKEYLKLLCTKNVLDKIKEPKDYFKALVEFLNADKLEKIYKQVEMDTETKFKFLQRFPYNEWYKFADLIDNTFIINYLGSFRHSDLLLLRDSKTMYELVGKAPYKERFKMYKKLQLNAEIVNETKRELKGLVKANLTKKVEKFKSLSSKNPLSVCNELLEQLTVFPPLIPLVAEVVQGLDSRVRDVLLCHIIAFIEDKNNFVKRTSFEKWFINICSFIKQIFPFIEHEPLYDFIRTLLNRRKYSCVVLLESVELPKDILDSIKSAHTDAFIYENYDLKLKMDVSDKYSLLTKRKVFINPTIANLKYLTPYEIKSITTKQVEHVEAIVNDLRLLGTDYFSIRNLSLLISAFLDHLLSHHQTLLKAFESFEDHEEEDIRVIGSSLVSKLKSYERLGKVRDSRESNTVKRLQISEPIKPTVTVPPLTPSPRPVETVEVGEIQGSIARPVSPTRHVNSYYPPPLRHYPNIYDINGNKIDNLEMYLQRNLPVSRLPLPPDFIYLSNLPVYDKRGERIKNLKAYLQRGRERYRDRR